MWDVGSGTWEALWRQIVSGAYAHHGFADYRHQGFPYSITNRLVEKYDKDPMSKQEETGARNG
jgi:hypothetical protein